MITADPFTQTERLLWFIAESHPGFADRVPVGNRVKLCESTATADRAKKTPQAADLPEVMLIAAGGQGEQNRTSSGEGFDQAWEFRVSTSYLQTQGNNVAAEIQKGVGPLKWELVKAFAHWLDRFPTHPWVRRITVVPFVDSPPGGDNARGPGWEAVVSVNVLMNWPNMEIERWL